MKTLPFLLTASLAAVPGLAKDKPNIIYILADDLGYSEIGSYGQRLIQTPNLDMLASNGIRFTQHYCGSPVSAPSRCVLLTGQHSGHAYIRGNHEWSERGEVWNYAKAVEDPNLEGQFPLADSIKTIAEYLRTVGYRTGAVGKWGLGAPNSEGIPNKQGFDFFFGYNCQRQAHTHYPKHLWKNEEKVWLNNHLVVPGTKLPAGADTLDPASYAAFTQKDYSGALFIDEARQFIEENRDQPFFLYFASALPHLALQAPKEWVDRYIALFGDEKPYLGNQGYFPTRNPRATYAAMVSYLDFQVGELIKKLKETGEYENTLIIFSSDNGYAYNAGCDPEWFNSFAPFNTTHGWGKGFVHEGGIRVPMIASWPGKIKPGSETELISSFYDVLPTLCEVAGIKIPENTDGISFLPTLLGKKNQKKHEFLFWDFPEYNGQQAVRMGPWKGLRLNMQKGNTEIQLFNLDEDSREQHDVAAQHPDIVNKIRDIMTREHQKSSFSRFYIKAIDN
jgi:arylsulfatase A-like enzyme